jgi:hypothetical protein
VAIHDAMQMCRDAIVLSPVHMCLQAWPHLQQGAATQHSAAPYLGPYASFIDSKAQGHWVVRGAGEQPGAQGGKELRLSLGMGVPSHA